MLTDFKKYDFQLVLPGTKKVEFNSLRLVIEIGSRGRVGESEPPTLHGRVDFHKTIFSIDINMFVCYLKSNTSVS